MSDPVSLTESTAHKQSVAPAVALPPVAAGFYCPGCGYELQGLTGDRCPECGESIAELRAPGPLIPWEQRAEIGRITAYTRTRRLIRHHSRLIWNAVAQDVDYRSARRFQLLSVTLATLPIAAIVMIAYGYGAFDFTRQAYDFFQFAGGQTGPMGFEADLRELPAAGWPLAIMIGLIFLCLLAWTGLPSYFFHPRAVPIRQQNRAIALSYYAGSSAMMWLGTTLAFFGGLLLLGGADEAPEVLMVVSAFVLLPILLTLYDLHGLARRLMPLSLGRRYAMLCLLPFLWLLSAGLILIGIPALLAGIYIVAASLR